MKLMTPELEAKFAEIGRQEDNWNPLVVCKIFNPSGAQTWYATEYNPEERVFFGFVTLGNELDSEWGYFSLDELEDIRTPPFGLALERDLYCGIQQASHYADIKLYPPEAQDS